MLGGEVEEGGEGAGGHEAGEGLHEGVPAALELALDAVEDLVLVDNGGVVAVARRRHRRLFQQLLLRQRVVRVAERVRQHLPQPQLHHVVEQHLQPVRQQLRRLGREARMQRPQRRRHEFDVVVEREGGRQRVAAAVAGAGALRGPILLVGLGAQPCGHDAI